MKKFLLILFTLLWISSTAFAASASQDPGGFLHYPWGTDFEVIAQGKDLRLVPGDRKQDYEFYNDYSTLNIDPQGNIIFFVSYAFRNGKLIMGNLSYGDKQAFNKSKVALYNFLGAPDSQGKRQIEYVFPTTSINITDYEDDSDMAGSIRFAKE